jgi:serralysin
VPSADGPTAARAAQQLPAGLSAGTRVATPLGARPVERLRAGDVLASADGGQLTLLRLLPKVLPRPAPGPDHAPLRIRAGAFGDGLPRRDLCLAPGQRLRLQGWAVEELCDLDRLAAPAGLLVDGLAVTQISNAPPSRFYTLATDRPGFLLAEGLPMAAMGPTGASTPPEADGDDTPPAALIGYLARLAATRFA